MRADEWRGRPGRDEYECGSRSGSGSPADCSSGAPFLPLEIPGRRRHGLSPLAEPEWAAEGFPLLDAIHASGCQEVKGLGVDSCTLAGLWLRRGAAALGGAGDGRHTQFAGCRVARGRLRATPARSISCGGPLDGLAAASVPGTRGIRPLHNTTCTSSILERADRSFNPQGRSQRDRPRHGCGPCRVRAVLYAATQKKKKKKKTATETVDAPWPSCVTNPLLYFVDASPRELKKRGTFTAAAEA